MYPGLGNPTSRPKPKNYKFFINFKKEFSGLLDSIDPTKTNKFFIELFWFGFGEKFC